MSDQAEKLRQLVETTTAPAGASNPPGGRASHAGARGQSATPRSAQSLLFTSGKGGVGTSNLVLNLGIALGELEQRVLLVDGDIGLANLDLLGGFSPRHDLGDVLERRCELADAVVPGPSRILLVPGAHAARTTLRDAGDAAERLAREVKELAQDLDFVLIDAGSGLGPAAGFLAAAADLVVVVSTPEPTSLADAHAAISRFHQSQRACVRVLINQARSHAEGVEVVDGIAHSSRQFKGAAVAPLEPGFVRVDPHVPIAVRRRRPFLTLFPSSPASRGVRRIARALVLERQPAVRTERSGFQAAIKARLGFSVGAGA
jgi:flagellar biosynthesis protein FlhG